MYKNSKFRFAFLLALILVLTFFSFIFFNGENKTAKDNMKNNISNISIDQNIDTNIDEDVNTENENKSIINQQKVGNFAGLNDEERARLFAEYLEKKNSLKVPIRGDERNTLDSVWKWWEAMIALQDDYMKKIPEKEEFFLSGRVSYDHKALMLIESLNNAKMNPVEIQEQDDRADALAVVYAHHIDEYLAKTTDENKIRSKQFAKAELLERYDINKQPYTVRTAQAGNAYENAYESGLREGKCLLRTAQFAAEKYANAYEYQKAIDFLGKAISDARSGNYEIRNIGSLNQQETSATISDINKLIEQYENAKPQQDKKMANAEKYDKMMEEQISENNEEVEEYKKRIERGEVPAKGLPGNSVTYDFFGSPITRDNSEPLAVANGNSTIQGGNISSNSSADATLLNEAETLFKNADYLGAAETCKRAGKIQMAAALLHKGIFILSNSADSKDWSRALELMKKMKQDYSEISSANEAPFEEAKLYIKLEMGQNAIEILNKWLEDNQDNIQEMSVRMMLVRLYMESNRPQDALSSLLPMYDKEKQLLIPSENLCAMVAAAYGACGDTTSSIAVWQDFKDRVTKAPAESLGRDSQELKRTQTIKRAERQIAIIKGEQ